MHNEFSDHLDSLVASPESKKHLDVHAIQGEAVVLFGKKEFDDAVRERSLFRETKKVSSGNLVKEWTGLGY